MSQAESINSNTVRHVAAIDLGSNSFHMLVVRILHDDVQPLFKYKERVRLAEGLDENNHLSSEAIERGVNVLKTFAEQLAPFGECEVRVVATHTLRVATNRAQFLSEASKVFPYPVEVVSGQEEARLVYLGVAETEHLVGSTLVIDIGGGSTEVAIGNEGELQLGRSHAMGCVSYTQRFFASGVDKKSYRKAKIAAQQRIERFVEQFRNLGWRHARVTSGTAQALIAAADNLKLGTQGTLTPAALSELRSIVVHGEMDSKIFKGISPERLSVLAGGLAIMDALFEILGIEEASFSSGALREGVLIECRKVESNLDTRSRAIQSLIARYHVDHDQALRVEESALSLWDSVSASWGLRPFTRRYLGYAALTHEIGLNISSSGLQKHSAYILENSTLPGFSVEQQLLVTSIVRFHRKRLRPEQFPELAIVSIEELLALILILRLSVVWHVNRHPEGPSLPGIQVVEAGYLLQLPEQFPEQYPLLTADLEREAEHLAQAGIELLISLS